MVDLNRGQRGARTTDDGGLPGRVRHLACCRSWIYQYLFCVCCRGGWEGEGWVSFVEISRGMDWPLTMRSTGFDGKVRSSRAATPGPAFALVGVMAERVACVLAGGRADGPSRSATRRGTGRSAPSTPFHSPALAVASIGRDSAA